MPELMRQEIEVWDVLPAIRRELAKSLVHEHRLSQRETAEKLGITEAAVSQYLSAKRAKGVVFGTKVMKEIRASAKKLMDHGASVVGELQRLCNLMDVRKIVCGIHHRKSAQIPKNCTICER
jgi:predicted transcriptional regulator